MHGGARGARAAAPAAAVGARPKLYAAATPVENRSGIAAVCWPVMIERVGASRRRETRRKRV
ncbi:hypothetical protein BURMUCGD1_1939 [Burkholderia multivorans CGD1]|nr:hypothetical protein BURMUCGD1_1939 [Burkholderia multivorans CGD1]